MEKQTVVIRAVLTLIIAVTLTIGGCSSSGGSGETAGSPSQSSGGGGNGNGNGGGGGGGNPPDNPDPPNGVPDEIIDAVGFDKILFIKRPAYHSSHFYTFFIDGLDRCFHPDNGIYMLDMKNGGTTPVVTCNDMPTGQNGIFGRMDLSFDAKKIVFDYKPDIASGFRIYEYDLEKGSVRQITTDPPDEAQRIARYDKSSFETESPSYNNHTDDMHPCYLPDGGIAFVSTRTQHEVLCNPSGQLSVCVMYRVDGDGSNMEKLSNGAVSEFNPTVTAGGQILYSRWEYVDKSSVSIKALWAMNPDGSKSVEIFGNNHNLPPTMWQPRQIPGKEHLFVFTGVPHCCEQSGVGTVLVADTSKDIRTSAPMRFITPNTDLVNEAYEPGWSFYDGNRWEENGDGLGGRLYADPYPVWDENHFLVSCKFNPDDTWSDPDGYSLYLIDNTGAHQAIYKAEGTSCWVPIPLKARTKPPVINKVRHPVYEGQDQALCIVSDIYQGLDNVPRGTVKWIRINEQIPRPWGSNRIIPGFETSATFPQIDAHLWIRLQHGIVPVEDDGSAYFTVPADRNIFFQALDENYMEIQRERTFVNFRPGEIRSCTGCHERTGQVPKATTKGTPLAMMRSPSQPGPQPGEVSGTRVLDYHADVQPVWDNNCSSCHSGDSPASNLDLTGTLSEEFTNSYDYLIYRHSGEVEEEERRSLVSAAMGSSTNGDTQPLLGVFVHEDNPNPSLDGLYLPPYTLGSHTSGLVTMLKNGHQGVSLTDEEMIKVTTWLDSNCQYYGTYYGRRHIMFKDHPNFRPVHTVEQALAPFPTWIAWDER